jgi:hypothetical protein
MAQIFYVHCPACNGRFPCHPELWQVDYDLLCPFCANTFPQETSPLIITATGERRPGRAVGGRGAPVGSPAPAERIASGGAQEDRAESM